MNRTTIAAAALASAFAAMPALAQSPSQPGGPAATNGVSGGTANGTSGVGGTGSFSGWLSDYQTQHQGRISRKAYMDEVGRRWDQADRDQRGLTNDQINQTYGYGPGQGASGTVNTAPGNMGPNDVKK